MFFKKAHEEDNDPYIEKIRLLASENVLPPAVRETVDRELELLGRIGSSSSEYTIGLAYIEYLLSIQWNARTEDNLDIIRAEKILNEAHYGLMGIKERVLEYLAVKKLKMTRKPKILIVDDEQIVRKNMSHFLGKDDYSVHTASTGSEALELFESTEFDVVLTDLKMEKMDGLTLLEKIKKRHPATQVIMLTALSAAQLRR